MPIALVSSRHMVLPPKRENKNRVANDRQGCRFKAGERVCEMAGIDKAKKAHLDRLGCLPCALCGAFEVHVHHILEGRIKGRKSAHFTAIPLCQSCHTDPQMGIHGNQVMLKIHKTTELQLLAETLEKIYG